MLGLAPVRLFKRLFILCLRFDLGGISPSHPEEREKLSGSDIRLWQAGAQLLVHRREDVHQLGRFTLWHRDNAYSHADVYCGAGRHCVGYRFRLGCLAVSAVCAAGAAAASAWKQVWCLGSHIWVTTGRMVVNGIHCREAAQRLRSSAQALRGPGQLSWLEHCHLPNQGLGRPIQQYGLQ